MPPADRERAVLLGDLRRLITDDGVAIRILAAVAVAAIFAFGFGATPEMIISMLVVGVVTALAETSLRAGKRS